MFVAIAFATAIQPAIGQTQMELNENAGIAYQAADHRMLSTYEHILKEHRFDVEFVKNLKTAQRAWLLYRDAEIKAIYPNQSPGYYGSLHPVCKCNELTVLTDSRTQELKRWINGVKNGDACGGSMPVRLR